MAHETNTFSPVAATYREFKGTGFVRGQELVDEYGDSFHTNAGFLQAEDDFGREVVPLLYAHAGPIGTITRDAFDRIAGEMLQLLKDQGLWNGVFLAQHGAAVSQYLVMSSSKCWGVSEDFIIYQGSQGRDACLERLEVSHSESPMAFQTDGPKAATPKGCPVVVIACLAAFQ